MLTTINTRILDNDHKGESGRGTKYQLEISVKSGADQYHETHDYFLKDLIEGSINLDQIKRPFKEQQRQFDDQQAQQSKQIKDNEAQERKDSVKSTPELDQLLDEAISANSRACLEYKDGKEKSINVIIGYVMKEIKKRNIKVNDAAFVVSTLLAEKLSK